MPYLITPTHHDVRSSDVFTRRLQRTLAAAVDRGPLDFPDLLLIPSVGARTVQSLATVAQQFGVRALRYTALSLSKGRSVGTVVLVID